MNGNGQLFVAFGVLIAAVVGPLIFISWFRTEGETSAGQWAIVTAVMLVAGILIGTLAIILLGSTILVAILVAWLWRQVILSDVHYTRTLSVTHLFPGQSAEISWCLANEKPLPVSWLRWREAMPTIPLPSASGSGLDFESLETSMTVLEGKQWGLDEVTALRSYESITRSATVKAVRRGYYRFGPATLEGSDVLGLFTVERREPELSPLTVYPHLTESAPLETEVRSLLGDWRRRASLIEDPTWFRGDRDYQFLDPMRSIDWRATARTGGLKVKTFEPSVHPKLMIVVNLHTFETISEGWESQTMEDVISMAASAAVWALDAGYQVGVHSNGALPDSNSPFRILPSSGENQAFKILDYLARIVIVIARPVEETLEELNDLPYGTALMICSSFVNHRLASSLADRATRTNVSLLLVGGSISEPIPRVSVVGGRLPATAA